MRLASDALSTTFATLADPTRRAILARLTHGEATVKELAAPFAMSGPAVSKHLRVLERAGLVSRSRSAQWRPRRLKAEPLHEVTVWAEQYREFWDANTARPGLPSSLPVIGFSPLGLGNPFTGRDGLLYVPASYRSETPAPLLIMLHGGGRSSRDWETPDLAALADSLGAVVLAPDSRSHGTWDIIESGNYDTDIPFLDQALHHTFDQCRIDPARVALGGFSDGAGSALCYGLANGDFTRAVVAFSPGFLDDRYLRGTPRCFVSHGSEDPVLSFTATRDTLVPFLRGRQLAVEWVPFQGGHTIPDAIGVQAFSWLGDGWS